ncbi:MAG: amphi-Trp domain-containing protein [Pseudodesulfovibrio sp.]
MEKRKVGVKMTVTVGEAVAYLENLLATLKSGSIEVRSGEQCVTLAPAGMVSMEIEAKVKKGKQKFACELAWTDPSCAEVAEDRPAPAAAAAEEPGKAEKEPAKEAGKAAKKDSGKEAGKLAKSAEKRSTEEKKSKKDKESKDSRKEKKSSKPSAGGDAPKERAGISAAGKTPE